MTTATPERAAASLTALVQQQTAVARQSLKTAISRAQRLLRKLADDLRETEAADTLRLHGELLKTSLGKVPRGASQVVLHVPWLGGDEPVVVPLRPELSAQDNVQRLFARAKGLARGRAIITQREDETLALLLRLEALREAVQGLLQRAARHDTALAERQRDPTVVLPERAGAVLRDVEVWLQAVAACRLRTQHTPERSATQRKLERKRPLPKGVVWFQTASGAELLAGKNAAANDALVTRLLRGRDLWFHVRDQTGAHVVLRSSGKAAHTEADIREAAMLCAHLTGIAAGDSAEVSAAQGTGVRKVKGLAAGQVYVSGERAVRVRVDAAVIAALYQRLPPPPAS